MMTYFNIGDGVLYTPKNITAKIIKAMAGDEYLIEFDDKKWCPAQMTVPGYTLKAYEQRLDFYDGFYGDFTGGWAESGNNAKYSDTHCRRCGDPWKETWIGGNVYYDCIKCNIKKEDA